MKRAYSGTKNAFKKVGNSISAFANKFSSLSAMKASIMAGAKYIMDKLKSVAF